VVGAAYHTGGTIGRVELRQLTYFVAVAEELHFGRAAERLHLAGPSLSQQISNLERELGTQLLVRDRRHVELTPAGSQFLTDAREVLGAAARAFDRARKGGEELPLRLGYVSWLPPEAAAMPDLRVRVDEWVLPSHTQAARVAEGSLDLAIAWIEDADIERLKLTAHLLWYERLEAVLPRAHQATRHESVPAAELTVLIDVDEASWWSWNRYASAFAEANHASMSNVQCRRRRHRRACIFRPCGPLASAGARVAETPRGADAAHADPPACRIPGAPVGLGAASPRR
jgi:DNA-binding transcriptional LysR family regulator